MTVDRSGASWLTYLLLVLAAAFFLLPVYLVVVTAFKLPADIRLATTWQLPPIWNWDSFVVAWRAFSPQLRNSLVLTVTATAGSAILGSLNGYVLSKWRFPGANVVFPLILFGMFIPYQSILIPLFRFLADIGLYGSLWGLILTHIVYGLPITTLIFRNFYERANSVGYAAAVSILLFLIILGLTLVQFRVLGRKVHYQ